LSHSRAWKFRPGSDPAVVQQILQDGCICLDYGPINLRDNMTRCEILETLRRSKPEQSEKGARAHVGQIFALMTQVSKGHLAVVPRDKGKFMMLGEVLSERPVIDGGRMSVEVRWLQTNVPLSLFEQDLRYSFMAIHKFCEVSRNNAAYRLFEMAKGKKDPGH
jgi:restriction system protein